jgi:hypothetical protein
VNNEALKVCLECLVDNTTVDYELIIESVQKPRDIYKVCNEMAERAVSDWIVFHNSDVFMAPYWAESMLQAAAEDAIVTGVIVECGAIGVAPVNIGRNFGMLPSTFRREDFERFVAEHAPFPAGEGWYFPSLHPREAFVGMGGFDLSKGYFPKDPLDIIYWNSWRASGGKIKHVRSYSYHLQHYCSEEEQKKAVRHVN